MGSAGRPAVDTRRGRREAAAAAGDGDAELLLLLLLVVGGDCGGESAPWAAWAATITEPGGDV